jgi:hypothetical protein
MLAYPSRWDKLGSVGATFPFMTVENEDIVEPKTAHDASFLHAAAFLLLRQYSSKLEWMPLE